jgi:hypothetical protein
MKKRRQAGALQVNDQQKGKLIKMLWYTGSLFLVIWLVLTFLLHKGGSIHILLFLAISFYLTQLAQDRRTKEYERSIK